MFSQSADTFLTCRHIPSCLVVMDTYEEEKHHGHMPDELVSYFPKQQLIDPEVVHRPKDYFAVSIVTTACCCLPLGVAALVWSSRVRTNVIAIFLFSLIQFRLVWFS